MFDKSMPALLACGFVAAGTFALAAPQAFGQFTSTSTVTGNEVHAGTLQVQLVDASGNPLAGPIVSVADAMPAMATKTYSVRLRNSGSLPAAVELHSSNLVDGTANSLNDVLVATVKNGATTLYTGNVAGISAQLSSIAAGTTATLTLELTWPDLPAVDDNPYQDAVLTFALVADASQLVA